MPKHIDPWAISMHLEFNTPARQIANATGERLEMLVHHLSANGHADLAVRLLGS